MHPGILLNQDSNMLHIMFSSHSEFVASSPVKVSRNMINVKIKHGDSVYQLKQNE